MIDATEVRVVAWAVFLADWSIRWGLVVAALAAWFAVRPPRRAATRHALCAAGLLAGLLLPVVPRWGGVAIPRPAAPAVAAGRPPDGPRMPPVRAFDSASADAATLDVPPDPARPVLASLPKPGRGAGWVASWAFVATWAGAVAIMSIRMIGGRRWLARLRAGATEVGESSRRLLGECREALQLTRRARLAAHPDVASPVTLGGLRPLILVPVGWDAWPEPDRRACLLHELAHLARRDDWAKLAQELVRIPFCFHPAVRWLLARLDREREILCDEAAVALGADAIAYARLLLNLARSPGRLSVDAAAARTACLPFFDRSTVAIRIERLLEDDMPRTLTPPSARRPFVLASLALAAGLGLGSLGVRAVEPPIAPDPKPPQAAKVEAEPADPPSRTIRGVILDTNGRPVPGAVVVAGRTDTVAPNHRSFTTDGEGHFAWPIPEGGISVSLYAHKPGRSVASWMNWLAAGEAKDEIELKLGAPEPFVAALVDGEGKPVVGAKVRAEMGAHFSTTDRADGSRSTSGSYSYYYADVLAGSPLEPVFEATTDDRGAFSFASFWPGTWLRLAVTAPDGRKLRVRRPTGAGESDPEMMTEGGFVAAPPGAVPRLIAYPAARVEGRIVTNLPALSVSGLKIWYQASRVPLSSTAGPTNFSGYARTDADGRFAFDGLNEGTINISPEGGPGEIPWTYRAARDVELKSGTATPVTIELIRGVEVAGKVSAAGTGRPLAGAMIGVYGPSRPRSGAASAAATTDDGGRYRFRLPPGETYFYLMGAPPDYAMGTGRGRTVTIPDGVARFEFPTTELKPASPAEALSGRVVDADGVAVAGAIVDRACEGGCCPALGRADLVTDARGTFRLPANANHRIPPGEADRVVVRVRGRIPQVAEALPGADGLVTVKLPAPANNP